ncbi:MAG: C25 family cysteine peptidase [Candidatus Hodarchaeota archaeon]
MIKENKLTIFLIIILFCMIPTSKNSNSNSSLDISLSPQLNNSVLNSNVDYLIITTDDFIDTLEPLAMWKTQKGLATKIETISSILTNYLGRNLEERIKNCITSYYTNNNTKWVLLAGDNNYVPSLLVISDDGYPGDGDFVSCDSFYTDLNNNWDSNDDGYWGDRHNDMFDYEPEVYVGRLPANTKNQMSNLVQKLLYYEKNPLIGNWMTHAGYASAILVFDQDWDDDDVSDFGECDGNRFLNFTNHHLPDDWSSTILALGTGIKTSDYPYNLSSNYANFKSVIENGCGIGTFNFHGSKTGLHYEEWTVDYDGDGLFDYTDDPFNGDGVPIDDSVWNYLVDTQYYTLNPEESKLGMFYILSCSTGTFDHSVDCLAENFIKNIAIGCIASSQVTWGEDQWWEREHGGWYSEGIAFRFWEQLFQNNHPGEALALAKEDYMSDRIDSGVPADFPEWEDKALKQYNLLGCPEVPIWLHIPEKVNITIVSYTNENVILQVTANHSPVENATVTITEDNNLLWKGNTSETGEIEVPYNNDQLDGLILTASKNGYVPFQIQQEIPIEDSKLITGYDMIITYIVLLGFMGICIVYIKKSKGRNWKIN